MGVKIVTCFPLCFRDLECGKKHWSGKSVCGKLSAVTAAPWLPARGTVAAHRGDAPARAGRGGGIRMYLFAPALPLLRPRCVVKDTGHEWVRVSYGCPTHPSRRDNVAYLPRVARHQPRKKMSPITPVHHVPHFPATADIHQSKSDSPAHGVKNALYTNEHKISWHTK